MRKSTGSKSAFAPTLLWFAFASLLTSFAAVAADEIRPPGQRRVAASAHALVSGRVVISPGKELDKATIILRDGRIIAVAADAPVPADATWLHRDRQGCVAIRSDRRYPRHPLGSETPLEFRQRAITRNTSHPPRGALSREAKGEVTAAD